MRGPVYDYKELCEDTDGLLPDYREDLRTYNPPIY